MSGFHCPAQGTRVTRNLFHDNTLPFEHLMHQGALVAYGEDIFIEVSHGPTLVDNNLLLSTRSIKLATQGVAVVHNLIAGSFTAVGTGVNNGTVKIISPRYTPYHVPHGTEIAGFMTILHGDMRFYNNIFVQQPVHKFLQLAEKNMRGGDWDDGNVVVGLGSYDNFMTEEEWKSQFKGYCGMGAAPSDRYYIPLPVWAGGNVYFNGAKPWAKEKDAVVDTEHPIKLTLAEQDGQWSMRTNLADHLPVCTAKRIDTDMLGMAFEPEQKFENPDGSPMVFNEDYFGNPTSDQPIAGPFARMEDEMML